MSSGTILRPTAPVRPAATAVRPVMLLTLNVPFDERAVAFAVETAAETGSILYVCDAVPVALGNPVSHGLRSFGESETRNDLDRVSALARQTGVRATQLVFHNPKPVKAALEVVRDQEIGLLVFGADRKRLGRWSFRRTAGRLRRDAGCLVWTNEQQLSELGSVAGLAQPEHELDCLRAGESVLLAERVPGVETERERDRGSKGGPLLAEPAGFESFMRAMAEPALTTTLPPPAEPPSDLAPLVAAAAEYGIEILGPPGIPT